MQSFLSRLNEYEYNEDNENENENKNKNNNRNNKTNLKSNLGKFRNLSQMRIGVGKYLGLDDQGKCILPWEWSI